MRIILQASLQSKRFPRKVLADLDGEPMLKRLLDRLSKWIHNPQLAALRLESRILGDSTLALPHDLQASIPIEAEDDELAVLVATWGYNVMRKVKKDETYNFGPLVEDLDNSEWFVRLTADNPLFDPTLIERLVETNRGKSGLFKTIAFTRHDRHWAYGYAPGMDAEILPVSSAKRFPLPELYQLGQYEAVKEPPYIKRGLSLTVDYEKDLDLVRECYAAVGEPCRYADIVRWWNDRR